MREPAAPDHPSPYDAVVFAGGGTRCFWQFGFWAAAAPALGLEPEQVAAVSAGAAAATAALIGKPELSLERFKEATAANPRNVYPERLLTERRVFPHHAMYRETILACVDHADIARLRGGPELRVVVTRPPRLLGGHLATVVGLGCYSVEKRLGDPLQSALSRRLGFSAEVVSARGCGTPDELADLILASSCTPPFTPLLRRGGAPVLDGCLVESVPLGALRGRPRRVLVLLTRPYRSLPPHPERTYVLPSEPIPLGKWDYTSPGGLQRTFDLGRRDGERFAAKM